MISRVLDCHQLFPGSVNLYAEAPVTFPAPARMVCAGEEWHFVPVIMSELAVGVAARRPPPASSEFIEVFACDQISAKLGLTHGAKLTIRILPGSELGLAA